MTDDQSRCLSGVFHGIFLEPYRPKTSMRAVRASLITIAILLTTVVSIVLKRAWTSRWLVIRAAAMP